ncbi:retrovirus-related pol polyprotein from transposon TNT 1-94 [Tanacetum coccineum]|uniref:Retrovirus-related pol polyprotein from transposon TNT 1-94 n=1 Tax=Tanacetum coccineum TaxID=301880 RepID=A0ABQ5CJH7_9ASTR
MTGDRSQLTNFVNKFLGTIKFGNDHMEKIMGYGDYQIENVTISRVYYVEGLGHNLFLVGLNAAKKKLFYSVSWRYDGILSDMSLVKGLKDYGIDVCLIYFGTINHLSRHDLVRGLLKLKFEKDHLCSACAIGKSKKKPYKPKSEDTNQEKLYLLHMDLCGPMRVISINGKKDILVIVDDYSRFTCFKCLRSKDEAPDFIIKFLKMIQVRLKTPLHSKMVSLKDAIDHPLENIIGKLARPVSTRLQLHEQALFCYYDAFLTSVEPKTYKDALTQSCWIEAMQEELNKFKCLEILPWWKKLDEDKEGKVVDPSHYRGMIGTLLCLTASRPDLHFAICMCARYQARPTEKHLHVVKRIFWYLKGTVNWGLWHPKDSSIALIAFADADHAGCQDTRRNTSGSMQFLGDRLVSWLNHIDIRFHFIKEHVKNGMIELYFVNAEYQLVDISTKALAIERIEFLINKLGMRSFTPETLKHLADEVDE